MGGDDACGTVHQYRRIVAGGCGVQSLSSPHTLALHAKGAENYAPWGIYTALIAMILASVTNLPLIATAVPLAWALTAVCYGSFWNGVVRLFIVTVSIGLASLLIHTVIGDGWEPLALVIAALLA